MATAGGPNIERDGLIFGLDTGYGVADNSTTTIFYPGEPTTNLVPSGENTGTSVFQRQGSHVEVFTYSQITDYRGRPNVHKLYINPTTTDPYADFGGQYYKSGGSVVGDVYTISFDYYITKGTGTPGMVVVYANGYKTPTSSGAASLSSATVIDLEDGWKRKTQTATITTAGNSWFRLGLNSNSVETEVYIDNFQVELKSHVTPYISGTRSSTQSLIDLTKTTDIDVSNVSFDSTGQPTFDGTDDYVDLGVLLSDIVGTNPSAITFEFIAKAENLTNPIGISGDYTGPAGTGFGIKRSSSNNKLEFRVYATGGIPRSTTDIPVGSYFYGICIWDGTSGGEHRIYFNGELETTDTSAGTTWNHGNGNLRIGDIYGSMGSPGEWQGEIPVFKIYDRALSADEVQQNYNAYKNRFNL